MLYRRFGYVQSRLLLDKQNEISYWEQELEYQDGFADNIELASRELDDDNPSYRKRVLKKLETKFKEYGKAYLFESSSSWSNMQAASLLGAARETMSMRRPTDTEYRSVRYFFEDQKLLREGDDSWIKERADLITLRPGREYAWLDNAIEHALRIFVCKLVKVRFKHRLRFEDLLAFSAFFVPKKPERDPIRAVQ